MKDPTYDELVELARTQGTNAYSVRLFRPDGQVFEYVRLFSDDVLNNDKLWQFFEDDARVALRRAVNARDGD